MASIPQDTELVNSWNFRIGSDILGVGVGWKSLIILIMFEITYHRLFHRFHHLCQAEKKPPRGADHLSMSTGRAVHSFSHFSHLSPQ